MNCSSVTSPTCESWPSRARKPANRVGGAHAFRQMGEVTEPCCSAHAHAGRKRVVPAAHLCGSRPRTAGAGRAAAHQPRPPPWSRGVAARAWAPGSWGTSSPFRLLRALGLPAAMAETVDEPYNTIQFQLTHPPAPLSSILFSHPGKQRVDCSLQAKII